MNIIILLTSGRLESSRDANEFGADCRFTKWLQGPLFLELLGIVLEALVFYQNLSQLYLVVSIFFLFMHLSVAFLFPIPYFLFKKPLSTYIIELATVVFKCKHR